MSTSAAKICKTWDFFSATPKRAGETARECSWPCAAVEDKIARWTMVPVNNGEGIQVLRYEPTEK